MSNKRYLVHDLVVSPEIFDGYRDDYLIDEAIIRRLSKELGFSYDMYLTMKSINDTVAHNTVSTMSEKSNHSKIALLVDDEQKIIIDYALDAERPPLLNSEFIHRIVSLIESSGDVCLGEKYYHKDDTIASVIIKRKAPVTIEEKYENKDSKFIDYDIGVLVTNDEIQGTYCRLVLYVEGHPLYLPASYYNVTATRYRKATSSSAEALEVLALRVIDDLRGDTLYSRLYDLHYRYRSNKYIIATYEEYSSLIRCMSKIPTIVESEDDIIGELLSKCDKFEERYPFLEDQKSSYIWRCTALGSTTLGELISMTARLLNSISAPPIEYQAIRTLLGEYISTNRIAEEIAKENIT